MFFDNIYPLMLICCSYNNNINSNLAPKLLIVVILCKKFSKHKTIIGYTDNSTKDERKTSQHFVIINNFLSNL